MKGVSNSRFFNDLKIDSQNLVLEKRSKNINKFLGEIDWFLKLPSSLKGFIPKIYDYSLDRENAFLKMQYCPFPNLGDIYLSTDYKPEVWNRIFDSIFSCIEKMREFQIKEPSSEINKALRAIYVTKTINRLEELNKNPSFRKYFQENIIINSKEYKPLDYYASKIERIFDLLIKDTTSYLSIIHGDFCLCNILFDLKTDLLKLVDPRGKFGEYTLHGDFRYELAKLSHSFNGHYESIINDQFDLKCEGNKIDFAPELSEYQQGVTRRFNKILQEKYPAHVDAVKFIEALLFLGMVPLHSDSVNRQIVMLATGVEKIDAVVKEFG